MTWRWACQCGLSWPSSATPSWASSYSSFLESSTRPAKCLRSRRMCQWPRSPSRRRPSRNACWQRPDDARAVESGAPPDTRFAHFFPQSYSSFLFLFDFICVICGASWAKWCGETNNNKLVQSSYLCCVLHHCPSAYMFALLYTGRPQFSSLLPFAFSLSSLQMGQKKQKLYSHNGNEGKELSSDVFHAQISRPISTASWFDTIRKLWHDFHQPYLRDHLKQEWKKTYIKVPLYCCMNACNSIFTVAQGNKWTLWTHCCFDWREPSASVWCDCCMMGYSSDNRMHVSSKALQIVSVYNRAFYKL